MINVYNLSPAQLFVKAVNVCVSFLELNNLPVPDFRDAVLPTYRPPKGSYGCGVYRRSKNFRDTGLVWVNSTACAKPASGRSPRQRSFPGYTSDRTVIGVVCHEIGHHVDHIERVSDTSDWVNAIRGAKVSSYEPYPDEAFAESVRLYILNPALLQVVAPKRYSLLGEILGVVEHERNPVAVLQKWGAMPGMVEAVKAKVSK